MSIERTRKQRYVTFRSLPDAEGNVYYVAAAVPKFTYESKHGAVNTAGRAFSKLGVCLDRSYGANETVLTVPVSRVTAEDDDQLIED